MRTILLPGLDGTGTLLEPLAARLEPLGLVPQVESYPTRQPLDYDRLAEQVASRLPRKGRFLLVGESFGGPLAIRLAAARPRGLAGLVLLVSFARSPVPRWLGLLARPWLFRFAPPRLVIRRYLVGPRAPETLVDTLQEVFLRLAPQVVATRVHEILACDVRAALARCPAPALYLAARHDRLVAPTTGHALQADHPALEVRTLAGPHLVAQCRPGPVARALADFAARLDRGLSSRPAAPAPGSPGRSPASRRGRAAP